MTPAQMLKRPPLEQSPPVPQGTQPRVDHRLIVESLPANGGHRATRKGVEPWILEQFDLAACPTCGEHLFHLVSKLSPDTHFYFCETDKSHRWTLVE